MAALTSARQTLRRESALYGDPIAANVVVHEGALVCLNAAGNATPGATATGLKARGVCFSTVDNTGGAAGAKTVTSEPGTYRFANSAGADEITRADIYADAFIVDDQTVAKTNGTSTRSIAGRIMDVDALGVWVRVG